jgi:hypothetical protein
MNCAENDLIVTLELKTTLETKIFDITTIMLILSVE